MSWQAPANFRRYGEVLVRVAPEFTTFGGSVQFRCPFPERHKRQDASPSAWAKIGDKGELVCRCSSCGAGWKEFVAYAGLPAPAWFPPNPAYGGRAATPRRPPVTSKIVAEYPYTDWRTGEVVAVKLRWEPGFDGRRRKDFTWRRPFPAEYRARANVPAGAKAWCGGPGVLRGGEFSLDKVGRDGTWYFRPTDEARDRDAWRLPPLDVGPYREWEARQTDRAVNVTEGEGKADLLAALGFTAVSSPNGKGSWDRDWGAVFNGRVVIVWPDRDPPDDKGLDWGTRVVASAIGYGAAAVCLPLVPRDGFPDDASVDVKDWLLSLAPDARAAALKSLVSRHKMYKRGA